MHTHVHTGTLASGPAKRVQNQQEKGTFRTDFGTLWEKARVGCSERIALKHVYY